MDIRKDYPGMSDQEIYGELSKEFKPTITIKTIRLDEENNSIVINSDLYLSFNQRDIEKTEDEESVSKIFKVIRFLFENRIEKTKDKVTTEGEPVSIDNLMRNSGCTKDGLRMIRTRINKTFKNYKNGIIPIEIKRTGKSYILEVLKG